MIGLDTNVLVRYLTQDDKLQSAKATRFIEARLSDRQPGFISLVVLVELSWVLRSLYDVTTSEIAGLVADLLATSRFRLQARAVVQDVVRTLQEAGPAAKADFADLLIARIASHEGCAMTVSFDRGAIRSAGMKAII